YHWNNHESKSPAIRCRIELKNDFASIRQLFDLIVVELYRPLLALRSTLPGDQEVKQWLNRFDVTITANSGYRLSVAVDQCDLPLNGPLLMEAESDRRLSRLNRLGVGNELVKVTSSSVSISTVAEESNHIDSSVADHQSKSHHHHQHHRRNVHRRHNAYAD